MNVDVGKVKALLLDERDYVRECAAKYLSEGGLGDAEASSLALRACETYGPDDSIHIIIAAKAFPSPEEETNRIVEVIRSCKDVNTRWGLLDLLLNAPLERVEPALKNAGWWDQIPQIHRERIGWRRRIERISPEENLRDLLAFLDKQFDKRIDGDRRQRCEEWVRAIARGGESVRPAVLETFERLRNDDGWPPVFLTELAGLLKIREVVPYLVDYLLDEESGDYLFENATDAIGLIGDPSAAGLIENRYVGTHSTFQVYAASALGHLKHPASVEALLRLKESITPDMDGDAKGWIFQACCEQLTPKAIDWAREAYLGPHTPDDHYMIRYLIATAQLHGLNLPEANEWHEEIVKQKAHIKEMHDRWYKKADGAENADRGDELNDEDDEWDDKNDEWDNDWDGQTNRWKSDLGEESIETYRRETEKVGRNDPCPCGSGKKYKKCCLEKRR